MRNWLGQEIVRGTVVYRGAREGNTSSYKIGVVESVDPAKSTARVHWRFEPGRPWRFQSGMPGSQGERLERMVPTEMDSKGSPAVDSLVVVDPRALDRASEARYHIRQWQSGALSTEVLNKALDSILGT